MKYLDINETIAFDEEKKKILFLNPKDEKKSFSIKNTQIWNLFLLLLSKDGKEYKTTELALKVIGNPDGDIKQLIYKLKQELNNRDIPCNCKKDEKDPTKIMITFNENNGILDNTGSYTLILPKRKNNTERVLTELYWNRYEKLSAQKEGEHKTDEIIAKIGDVYQLPLIQESGKDCRWGINNRDLFNQNLLIEAPNGYGKTTFMRSLLLVSTYIYREGLSPKEKQKYELIKQFHGIDDTYLCIYIECKNIDSDELENPIDSNWLYECLSKIESIRIDRYITRETFDNLIRDYNLTKRLIILVDGFDEALAENRLKLIKRLNEFQQDEVLGCNSRIILSTRPLFWNVKFYGYKRYTISNRNIIDDKKTFLQYVKSYLSNSNANDAGALYEKVIQNYYLKEIACTPAIIVWIIREYMRNGAFYESMERIIEQIMLRYKSRELTVYKEQYKRVYEELAYKYLCLAETDEGLEYIEAEMLSLVRACIERIELEGNRKFNKIFADNKTDEELGELFLTNVALMEFLNGHIKFATPVFAYHLAARKILRAFKEGNNSDVCEDLDLLPCQSRYYVMVIASSLVLHLKDDRFFEDYGSNATEVRFEMSPVFVNYLKRRWNALDCTDYEKQFIQNSLAHILLKYYGDNVYTNRNIEENKDYVKWMESILEMQLIECSDAVAHYREQNRKG